MGVHSLVLSNQHKGSPFSWKRFTCIFILAFFSCMSQSSWQNNRISAPCESCSLAWPHIHTMTQVLRYSHAEGFDVSCKRPEQWQSEVFWISFGVWIAKCSETWTVGFWTGDNKANVGFLTFTKEDFWSVSGWANTAELPAMQSLSCFCQAM